MDFEHSNAEGYPRMADEELEEYLSAKDLMTIATLDEDGWPHNTPVTMLYVDGRVAFGSLKWKRKIKNIENDPRVCCSIEGAVDSGNGEVRGVMIQGEALILGGAAERAVHEHWFEAHGHRIDYDENPPEEILEKRAYVEVVPREVLSWGGTNEAVSYSDSEA